jgi:mersacidin/lichenicidin family type 2 lantibiotic
MSNQDIIRAWKDEDYRLSLSEAERALLPEHPAGLIELSGAEITGVDGGGGSHVLTCIIGCTAPDICIPRHSVLCR